LSPTDIAETQHVPIGAPFAQGDIILLPERACPPHLGVIINADCDLHHDKTDGVCSYLPIYTFSEYIEHFWLPNKLEEFRRQSLFNILQAIKQPKSSLSSLEAWLDSADHTALSDRLSEEFELTGKLRIALTNQVEQHLDTYNSSRTPTKSFLHFCRAQKDPESFLEKQLRSAYQQLAEGHLFLNEIFGRSQLGFVIRLRRIYAIDRRNYFQSESDFLLSSLSPDQCAIRLAKLTSVFQYKLLQLFALQFSRIGLPDELTHMHQLVITDAAMQLLREYE